MGTCQTNVTQLPPLDLGTLPITLALPGIERSSERILAENFMDAQQALDKAVSSHPGLIEDIAGGRTDHYTFEELSLYQSFVFTRDALRLRAGASFARAMLSDSPSDADRQNWENFKTLLNTLPLNDPLLFTLLTLSDSRIPVEDRRFFYNCLDVLPQEREQMKPELGRRIIDLYRKLSLALNGWENLDRRQNNTLFRQLGSLYSPDDPDQFLKQLFSDNLFSLLSGLSQGEAQNLLQMSQEDFIKEFARMGADLDSYPIGSNNLMEAALRYADIQAIAIARGLFIDEMAYRSLPQIPDLSDQDLDKLSTIIRVALTPFRTDDTYYLQIFRESLETILEKYLSSLLFQDNRLRFYYINMLNILYKLSPGFSVSFSEITQRLESLAQEMGVDLGPTAERIENVAALFSLPASISVAPEGLPEEVKQVLQATGQWELVRDNVREIRFAHEIISDVSRDAVGSAFHPLRLIEIKIKQGGRPVEPWEIADILVHEAAHLDWANRAPRELQSTTPDERNSFLTEAQFLRNYLDLVSSSAEARAIAFELMERIIPAEAANLALGYSRDTMDVNYFALPSPAFLSSHGLSQLEDLNMSIYPNYLAYQFLLEPGRLEEIVDNLGFEEGEKTQAVDLLGPILSGDARLETEINVSLFNAEASLPNLVMRLTSSDGSRRQLSAGEIEILDRLFFSIFKSAGDYHDPSGQTRISGIDFIMHSSRISKIGSLPDLSLVYVLNDLGLMQALMLAYVANRTREYLVQ